MDCSLPDSFVFGDSPGKNWSGLPCPPPGELPNSGIEPRSLKMQADSLPSEPPGKSKNTGAYPFSRRTSWPRNQPGVSCIAGELSYRGSPFQKHTAHQNWIKKKKTIWTDLLLEVNWNLDFKNSHKLKSRTFGFTGEFHQTYREESILIFLKLFQKIEEEWALQRHSTKPRSLWYQN